MDGGNEILIIIGIEIEGKIGTWIWILMVKNMGERKVRTTQCYHSFLGCVLNTFMSRVRDFAFSYDHVFYLSLSLFNSHKFMNMQFC